MKLEDIKKIGVENCEYVFFQKFKAALDANFDLMTKIFTTGLTKNDIENYETKLKKINSENYELKLKEINSKNMEVKEDVD